jgi:hypothetical protein
MKTATSVKWQKIADEYVALKRQLEPLSARMGQLAHLIKDDSPVDSITRQGDYTMHIHDDSRTLVSKDTIVAELGASWYSKHAHTTKFRTIRIDDERS